MRPFNSLALATAVALAVSACTLAPTYERPDAPVASTWVQPSSAAPTGDVASNLEWQAFVLDPELRRLIEVGLSNNRDLRRTLLDVDAARATYRVERSRLLPEISAQGQGTRQRMPADVSSTGQDGIQTQYQAGGALSSFELDLFGRVRSMSQSALQEYLATEEAGRAARNLLIDNIARAYLSYHAAADKMEIVEDVLASRRSALELVQLRAGQGLASDIEANEAIGLAAQAEVELRRATREREQSRNALHLLVGTRDITIADQRSSYTGTFAELAPGLPSEMIQRRPDIIAAEHKLRARNADIGAARAAFFPSITLTGMFGSASPELSGLFDSGTRAWSFAPQVNIPLFAGGRNKANLDLSKVRKEQAVASYEHTIQAAFFEVADSLVAIESLRGQEQAQQRLATSSETSAGLAKQRYDAGVDGQLVYLDAERRSLSDKLELLDVHLQVELARSMLFRTLGGGWAAPGATAVIR